MAQDPTTSPPRPPQTNPPALQSTPQAKGSATISEHINTLGVKVDDIRQWITRDVENFEMCGIDKMLTDLLVDCTNKSQESVEDAYKTRLFKQCLHKVLPLCNGTDKTPLVDGLKGPHKIKETLGIYSEMKTEKELYPQFVTAANTALLFLEKLDFEDIRSAGGSAVCFQVQDPMVIRQRHQDHVSERKPDVIVVSENDICDEQGELGTIYSPKERFLKLATEPPSPKKTKSFEWRDVRTFVEFKKAKSKMQPPPEEYCSQTYTPPKEEYLTLDTLNEPELDALPEGLVPSGLNPRPPPQEPVRRSSRQTKASRTVDPDSNTLKRNSDHFDSIAEPRSKRMKPAQPQPKDHPAIVQAGYYAAEMFTAHTARLHVFGLIVVGDVLYFWRYDRQGNIQCSGFNFIQDLPRFLVLLLAMQRFREQHWGLHPKIDPEFGPRPPSHKTTLTGDEGEEINVTLELSDKERVSHYGLNSRATNLFSIKSDKLSIEDDLVVKLFWAEATRTSEPDILKRVYEIAHDKDVEGHVPVMLWYKSFEDTSTAKIRMRLGLKPEGGRVLYMIIFRKLRPITELTGRDFLLAWWETVKCHLALWKNNIYHRDISPSNLMYRKVEGKIMGVLNDFDLASTHETATGTERTGTVPFMALALLQDEALQGNVRHAYEHDAESFIWVLIWISLRYDDGKTRKHGRPLDAWLRVDAVGCRKEKTDFLESRPTDCYGFCRGVRRYVPSSSPWTYEVTPSPASLNRCLRLPH
ncbi:hypothetical protein V8E55_012127 [Tylopilus felleus]